MSDVRLRVPSNGEDLDSVRALMRAFVAWHRERHPQDLALIDKYFDEVEWENELATLPGKYAPPAGALFLAAIDDAPVGCVAMRMIDADRCEMKRMFIYPEFRGRGIGRVLGDAVIEAGRRAGYRTMLLDTSINQREAQTLYRSIGFKDIPPYYSLPEDLKNWLVFMSYSYAEKKVQRNQIFAEQSSELTSWRAIVAQVEDCAE